MKSSLMTAKTYLTRSFRKQPNPLHVATWPVELLKLMLDYILIFTVCTCVTCITDGHFSLHLIFASVLKGSLCAITQYSIYHTSVSLDKQESFEGHTF